MKAYTERPVQNIDAVSLCDSQFRIAADQRVQWGEPTHSTNGVSYWGSGGIPHLIVSSDKSAIGFYLGILIDYERREIIDDPLIVSGSKDAFERDPVLLEEQLYRYGGRWIAVVTCGHLKRVYVDSNATLGVVFDPTARIAGSTSAALLSNHDYAQRFRGDLYRSVDVANAGWFISGLTAHQGVERLLPNHYLDLNDWVQRRHWPKPGSIRQTQDVAGSLRRLSAIVTQQIETLVASGRTACCLSAGYETRLLLACSAAVRESIDYVTVAFPGTARDVYIATVLADAYGLRHRVLPRKSASKPQSAHWLYNSGHCVGGILATEHPSTAPFSAYDFVVGGLGGEVARGFFYRKTDTGGERLSARNLVARAGLPPEPALVTATDAWLRDAPELSAPELLDLAYVELRMAPWGFPAAYTTPHINEIHPLVCRESYELMFGLPYESKRNNPLMTAIQQTDPTLLNTPVNRYGDFRDQVILLSKLVQPRRIVKKVRKLFM